MKIWQVSFKLIPETHFDDDRPLSETELREIVDEKISGYQNFELPSDYQTDASSLFTREGWETDLNELLAPDMGWSGQMEYWGDETSHDITIWRGEDDQIEIIEARIDGGNLDHELLDGLLSLAKRWKCVLVETSRQTVCRMSPGELRDLIVRQTRTSPSTKSKSWLPFFPIVEEYKNLPVVTLRQGYTELVPDYVI